MTIDDRESFCLFSFILAKISSEQTESLIIHSCLILTSSKCHLNYYINPGRGRLPVRAARGGGGGGRAGDLRRPRPPLLPPRPRQVGRISTLSTISKYLLLLCSPEANTAAIRLLLGPGADLGRAFAVQSIGGTGPLRLGAEFLRYNTSQQ